MEGKKFVTLRGLGDKRVLIIAFEGDNLKALLDGVSLWLSKIFKYLVPWKPGEGHDNRLSLTQSYPTRALDRRLQVDWARDAREGPRVLTSFRVDFESMG